MGSHRPRRLAPLARVPVRCQWGAGGGSDKSRADVIHHATVTARFDKDEGFDAARALLWLRDKPASVTVELRIQVDGDLPRTDFRNGVIEPVEEKGHDVSIATS